MNNGAYQAALGRVVRRRRTAKALNQDEFAAVVGVHRTYAGAVERGERNVSLSTLLRFAAACDLTAAELLAEAEAELAAGNDGR